MRAAGSRCRRARRSCRCRARRCPPRAGRTTRRAGSLRGRAAPACASTRARPRRAPTRRWRAFRTATPHWTPPRAWPTSWRGCSPSRRPRCCQCQPMVCRGWAYHRCALERHCTACCLAAARHTPTRPLATRALAARRRFPQASRSAPHSIAPRSRQWAAPLAPRRVRALTKASRRACCLLPISTPLESACDALSPCCCAGARASAAAPPIPFFPPPPHLYLFLSPLQPTLGSRDGGSFRRPAAVWRVRS